MKKIGYLGPAGTFCHEATVRYLNSEIGVELIDYSNIPALAAAIGNRALDEGVVPVENSWEGTVNLTLDSLSAEANTAIKGEVVLPIRHYLLAADSVDAGSIKKVLSHPQALAQCRCYLDKNLPGVELEPANSTAEAARLVAGRRDWAAIGSQRAARAYGLQVIGSEIQDGEVNETRFVVLSQTDGDYTGRDKTSLLFSAAHRPGSLYEILAEFAGRGINLSKIESRPAKRKLGEYIFFVDIEGHRTEPEIWAAIEAARQRTGWLRVLGSYPRFEGVVEQVEIGIE